MSPEEWSKLLQDPATRYQIEDVAIALVGEPTDVSNDAQPTLICRVVHVETDMRLTFTFEVPHWLVDVMGNTFTRMAQDIANNVRLNDAGIDHKEFE